VEDDAVVVSHFLDLLPEIERELANTRWSVLLLGYMGDQSPARHFPIELISPHVARADHWEFIGSHFVAINGAALDDLIDHFEQRLAPGGHRIGVDGILNEYRKATGQPTLVCVPNLARQSPSPSGINARAGLRTKLLSVDRVQRAVLVIKRALWDAEAMMPSSWAARIWNLRSRLTARARSQYTSESVQG
jgi:hypothetical protein